MRISHETLDAQEADGYLPIAEAARRLRVHRSTLARQRIAGTLAARQVAGVWYVRLADAIRESPAPAPTPESPRVAEDAPGAPRTAADDPGSVATDGDGVPHAADESEDVPW